MEVERADYDAVLVKARRSLVRVVAVRSDAPQRTGNAVVQRYRPVATVASGVVIDAQGHVLTSARTVVGNTDLQVRTHDGHEVSAELLGFDQHTGLALLQIPPNLAPHLAHAPPQSISNGSTVLTLGHSFGQPTPTHDVGLITWRYQDPVRTLLQMTNTLLPGHTGGAAIDEQGRLIGVIIAELSPEVVSDAGTREASQRGRSFAIPIDVLPPLVEELRSYGTVRRGYIGVRIEQGRIIDPDNPDEPFEVGVAVTEVIQGGPAWNAGLRAGDLVVAVDGEAVNSPDELMELVVGRRAGSSVNFVWVRDQIRHEEQVVLATPPESLALNSVRGQASHPVLGSEQIQATLDGLDQLMDSLGVKPVPAR
jgi:S1-C subfamily serine protease